MTVLGIETDTKLVQPLNDSSSTAIDMPRPTDTSRTQPLNAPTPMLTTESGTATVTRLMQSLKANGPIATTVSGSATVTKVSQPSNELDPMILTLSSITTTPDAFGATKQAHELRCTHTASSKAVNIVHIRIPACDDQRAMIDAQRALPVDLCLNVICVQDGLTKQKARTQPTGTQPQVTEAR